MKMKHRYFYNKMQIQIEKMDKQKVEDSELIEEGDESTENDFYNDFLKYDNDNYGLGEDRDDKYEGLDRN